MSGDPDALLTHEYTQAIFDSAVEGIWTIGLDGLIKTANRSALQMFGYADARELIGRNSHEMVHYKRADGTVYPIEECPIFHAFKKGESVHLEDEVLWRKDGSSFHADYRSTPLRRDGEIIGGVVTFLDNTKRRRLQDELTLNQAWLNATLTGIGDAVLATDAAAEPRVTYLNPVCEQLTGWTNAEAVGRPVNDVFNIITESTREPAFDPVAEVIRTGQVVTLHKDTVLIAKNGAEYVIEDSAAPIRGAAGRIEGVVLVFRDVTEEQQSRKAQESYQRWLERAIKEMPTAVCMADPITGSYIFGNDALDAMMGRKLPVHDDVKVQMGGMQVLDPATGRALDVSEWPSTRAARGEVVKDAEVTWITDTGRYDVAVTAHTIPPLYGDDGTIMLAVHDNTALKTVQKSLRESEARLNLAISSAGMGTWHIDVRTGETTVSAATAAIFGLPELSGNIFDLIAKYTHPDDVEPLHRVWTEAVESDRPYEQQYRIIHPDGAIRWLDSRGRAQLGPDGKPEAFSGVVSDITERKLYELGLASEQLKLNAVFQESPIGMALLRGKSFRFEKVNSIFTQLVGPRDYLGRTWREVYSELSDSPLPAIMANVLKTGETYHSVDTPLVMRADDGDLKPQYYTFTYSRIELGDAEGPGILLQCQKTTEAVESRDRAAQTSDRLAAVVEVAKIGFYDWDVATDRVTYSDRMKRDWEIDDHTPLAEALSRIHVDDRDRVSVAIAEAFHANDTYRQTYRIVRTDGSVRWIEAAGEIEYARDGQAVRFFGTSLDVTDRKTIENSLVFEQHKLETMFERSPAAMAFWRGPEHIFEKVNPQYQAIFAGRTLVSKPLLEALPELKDQPFGAMLTKVLETGEPEVGVEVPALIGRTPAEMETRYFDYTYLRVNDPQGKPYGVYDHAIDVTDRVRARAELEISKNQAELANQTKSSFLANMSHEIRTPLGAILGFTDLLKEQNVGPEERRQYLDTISRNGKALTRIIDDILDLAKVESGQLEIEKIEFSLLDLIDDVMDLFRESTKARAIYLRVNVAPGVPRRIVSDPTRLRQIMINIVGNAVKFTNEGGVTIDISMKAGGALTEFEIQVKDTGVGLTAEQKDRLFKPFVQADNSTTRKFGGTGLGLALSKRLAVALGGDVRVEARDSSGGCTFCITFLAAPALEKPRHPVVAPERATPTDERLRDVRVLVADDSPDNQFLINLMLAREGAEVELANNGQEAFRLGMNGSFDVVLMDIQMPVMDGYEATRALREAGFRKPIIALTAHAMAEERARSLAAGCNGHLTKPIDAAHLMETLTRLLHST